jgi:hypothetical protein
MKAWLRAIAAVLCGYLLLALAVLWLRNLCLPVSTHEHKWQCGVTLWLVAAAYFGCGFLAALLAGRRKLAVGFIAFALLFAGHALLPDLALVSFGKRWYSNAHTVFFAVIPAVLGVAAAMLFRAPFIGRG